MNRNAGIFCSLVIALAALSGCSSKPAADDAKKSTVKLDTIVGKAQKLIEANGATDAALNAGGDSIYLWVGERRYRLFLRSPVEIIHGERYVVEGIDAQKAIDEIGDPDQGKNGYPLESSCRKVVTMAWSNLSFDAIDANVALVKARANRYPARPLFLVTKIRPATATDTASAQADKDAAPDDENVAQVTVPAEKQRAVLVEGQAVQPAPLWRPEGGTAKCSVIINTKGRISDLQTGAQLCEVVPWSKFRYQPTVKGGHPVKVSTDVEVKFEPRK